MSLARLIASVAALAFSLCALADGSHTFWIVNGDRNTVYLLGSVHVLKVSDSELPPEVLRAYTNAKAVVLETDVTKFDTDKMLGAIVDFASLPADQTLERSLGPEAYKKLTTHAEKIGLDVAFVSHFQPWFVALTMEQLERAKLGLDPAAGVDMQLERRANTDRKPIIGLEPIEDQLGIFRDMSPDDQRRYLLNSLAESEYFSKSFDAMIAAWRTGDVDALEAMGKEAFRDFPDFGRKIVTDRNRKWLPKIIELLHEHDDYLVIVGALHLVGREGIVNLLRARGYNVEQR